MAKTIIDNILERITYVAHRWITDEYAQASHVEGRSAVDFHINKELYEAKQSLLKALLDAKPEKKEITFFEPTEPEAFNFYSAYSEALDEYDARIKELFDV